MADHSSQSISPIPTFYCCYLLRSTVRHASLYIGSTPDPSRRLAQHNGDKTGGAKRTSREKLRPWEMVVIVSGFMNRVGALQFEWAWQHTQGSRHVEVERGGNEEPGLRICPRTGKEVKTRGKPRSSLRNILANLHILLQSPYFSEWPLEVQFFSEDVYRAWQDWSQRADGLLDDRIKVITAFGSEQACDVERKEHLGSAGRIGALDVGYDHLAKYVEKSLFLLESEEQIDCGVCKQRLDSQHDMIAICSHNLCRCASHLLCLASHFLGAAGFGEKLVPREGTCPACRNQLEWPILMKEITLRFRGQEEIKRLVRRRRRAEGTRKAKKNLNSVNLYSEEDTSDAPISCTKFGSIGFLNHTYPCADDSKIGELGSSIDSANSTNSDSDSVRTITPQIELYSRRKPSTKANCSGSYTNKSDWDNAEIIE
ncbi:structure-specific endonuclease subunit SLX1, variant [Blastomyces gilchristii SLH14081]|uniref:Structure-specific endonuclease subunit SLX1 n=1 Tax=Blastomyces gilchristii (strain SLH14081) TaxID=559298 RepID=A0A179UCV9_BLAGS|nr:structure-specific endonuclease subunit SLX1, variant [Blastomyces gilchristii SLH14081]XP_031576417.1 structure-specific endonuclease subunit SLX1 [Blastomyces gilchristii SLH14081]OAT04881.1 structure-specific endonuclease subunit SLX1 [Blastomyces gilchristii SLH14081]OAT04882.1 structure-specific endonuclease subunit SLX1, variant [Blastomyces gilchristii SLH14081]